MELKDFIKTAVSDIVTAVSELQAEMARDGAIINPALPHPISNGSINFGQGNQRIQNIEFDVALTTSESTAVDGGAKAGVAIFAAKVGTAQQSQAQNVSRLSFAIPIALPVAVIKSVEERVLDTHQQSLRTHKAKIDS